MNDMNPRAVIGGNAPPEPIDAMLAIQNEFEGVFAEVANWLDGTPVESDEHMRAVDALLASVKDAARMAKDAKEAEYRPHKTACDAVVTRWKAFLDDLDRQAKGLAAAASDYKRKREAERQAAEREARAEAERKMAEAEAAARAASKNDIEAQREAAALAREAAQAQGKIAELRADKTRGLRTVHKHEITDHRAALHWIATNDREAVTEFIVEYVRRHSSSRAIDGVRVWTEKEAF